MRASRIAFTLIVVALALSACSDTAGNGDGVTTTMSGDTTTTTSEDPTTTSNDATTTTSNVATTTTSGDVTTTTSGDGGGDTEVTMVNISFEPDEITVDAGTEVTWVNEDQVGHTTTSDDTNWDSGALSSGETFSHTFEEPGTYTYFCEIHPTQMQATVIVEG